MYQLSILELMLYQVNTKKENVTCFMYFVSRDKKSKISHVNIGNYMALIEKQRTCASTPLTFSLCET